LLHRAGCIIVALGLAACAFELPSKKIDYQSASSAKLPSLEVPPDLTKPGTDDRFAVPDVNAKGSATYSAYSKDRQRAEPATGSAVLPQQADAHVERAGTQRWLVVKGQPDALWPVVKDFWQETGFVVNVEKPEAGVMETDWAENRAKLTGIGVIRGLLGKVLDNLYSTSERDKFRTRLERGAEPGTTEIYISHRGMEEVYTSAAKDDTRWQPRPPDPDLEAEMLRRLMVRLGVAEEKAKEQIASARENPQATLSQGQDGVTLALHEQFDRAWRRVGLALDRVGFTVEDRDRSNGVYFVRYIDPDADNKTSKSWFSRLKFWGSNDAKKNEQYRVVVKDVNAGAEVSVLNKDGGREGSDTTKKILSLLYEELK
jgi:outer membrane protein assembly factor BamC